MISRLIFPGIVVFWLVMNTLLWRAEYGSHGNDMPVPVALVWKRILQSPDPSTLNVYQSGQRTGYCEFSTSVGQQMAALDNNNPPPEGLVARAGYQIHLAGNVALGSFTNRVKFDGRVRFSAAREWRELNLKISSRFALAEIHSLATNQTIHLKISGVGVSPFERNVTFAELEKPDALIRAIAGNFAGALLNAMALPGLTAGSAAPQIQWDARLTRVKLGGADVPAYRLETRVLGQPAVIEVSTLGEILRVQLPGQIMARIDEWNRHD